jgi:hypothetical protein
MEGGLLSRPFPDGLPVVLGLPAFPLAILFRIKDDAYWDAFRLSHRDFEWIMETIKHRVNYQNI